MKSFNITRLQIYTKKIKNEQHYQKIIYLFSKLLTVGASRLIEAQMDLPRLLLVVDFQISYSDASNIYVLSWIYWERASLIAATASDAYNIASPVWGEYGSNVGSVWVVCVILINEKWSKYIRGSNSGH